MSDIKHIFLKLPSLAAIFFIRIYQYTLSSILPGKCRFTPTCSQYTIECIQSFGIMKGVLFGLIRLSKCHPCGGFGDDPIPVNTNPDKDKPKQ